MHVFVLDFLPFGEAVMDTIRPGADDMTTAAINLNTSVVFYRGIHDSFFVSYKVANLNLYLA